MSLIYIDFPHLIAVSHPKFFTEHRDNIGASFSFFSPSFLFLFFLLSFLSFLLSSSRMVYNTLENFPDWKRANLNELLSVLGVEGKKTLSMDPDFQEDCGSHLLLTAPLPLVSVLEWGGEEQREARRWWRMESDL